VKSPLEGAPGQVRVVMDSERANSLGVTANAAFQNIAWALRGWQLPRFQEEGRELPLIIEYDEEEVAGLSTLKDLQVFTGETVVPLASFADLQFEQGSRTIRRRNGQVNFTIQGRVDSPLQQKPVSDAGYELLKRELELPRGYAIGEEGLVSTRQEEEMTELLAALVLSIVLVFLLMGILFESFLLPFSVLFTIPFAIMGAYWTLFLSGTTMDSVGWIGMIVLVGVVVNNGIVLMDRIHGLRRSEGLSRREAVIQGAGSRVRPIVMTALTTVIGLLPMAISEPSGDSFDYRALATCVAGGLAISTFFTLWVVPLAYTVFDDLANAIWTRFVWSVRPVRRSSPARADAVQ
jgi:HAE1 family hydrophobic/amphiphilic exporter-1